MTNATSFTRIGRALAAFWAAILCSAAAPSAQAVVIAKDLFLTGASPASGQYNTAASLIGQNPTIPGFSGGWFASSGSSMSVSATSLTFTGGGHFASSGGALFSDTNTNRVHRLFDATLNPFQSTDAGTVYMSYLYQNTNSTGNGYIALEMHNGGNSDSFRTFQLGVSQGSSDFPIGSSFGYRVNNSASLSRALGARNTTVNLFLIKFNLSTVANGDSVTVWHNPTISSLTSDPAGGVTASGFNFLADRMGVGRFGTASTFDFTVDELRIGSTLGDAAFLSCDINGNGACNSSDMYILSQNMFTSGGYAEGDIDGNGTIDFADYRLLKDHPGRVVGFDPPDPSTAVPEPTTVLFVVLAAPGAVLFRRPRRDR